MKKGLRAVSGDRPIHPEDVETHLGSKLADALGVVTEVMLELTRFLLPSEPAKKTYHFYEALVRKFLVGREGGASREEAIVSTSEECSWKNAGEGNDLTERKQLPDRHTRIYISRP